eukprot:scaffold178004_cov20-Tisochrysis_lutea.AAC.3
MAISCRLGYAALMTPACSMLLESQRPATPPRFVGRGFAMGGSAAWHCMAVRFYALVSACTGD